MLQCRMPGIARAYRHGCQRFVPDGPFAEESLDESEAGGLLQHYRAVVQKQMALIVVPACFRLLCAGLGSNSCLTPDFARNGFLGLMPTREWNIRCRAL